MVFRLLQLVWDVKYFDFPDEKSFNSNLRAKKVELRRTTKDAGRKVWKENTLLVHSVWRLTPRMSSKFSVGAYYPEFILEDGLAGTVTTFQISRL